MNRFLTRKILRVALLIGVALITSTVPSAHAGFTDWIIGLLGGKGVTAHCDIPRGPNAKCLATSDCRSDLYCKIAPQTGSTPAPPGVCSPKLGKGATCSEPFDCAAGLACQLIPNGTNGMKSICVTQPKLNEPCDLYADSDWACAGNLVCQWGTLKCVTPPERGQAPGLNSLGRKPVCAAGLVSIGSDPSGRPFCDFPIAKAPQSMIDRAISDPNFNGGSLNCMASACAPGNHCDLKRNLCVANRTEGQKCIDGNDAGDFQSSRNSKLTCIRGYVRRVGPKGSECSAFEADTANRCDPGLACVRDL